MNVTITDAYRDTQGCRLVRVRPHDGGEPIVVALSPNSFDVVERALNDDTPADVRITRGPYGGWDARTKHDGGVMAHAETPDRALALLREACRPALHVVSLRGEVATIVGGAELLVVSSWTALRNALRARDEARLHGVRLRCHQGAWCAWHADTSNDGWHDTPDDAIAALQALRARNFGWA